MNSIITTLTNAPRFKNTVNFYLDKDYRKVTLHNVLLYFKQMKILSPRLLLIGEAPGYKGCALTGVPFTSEYIISNGIKELGVFGKAKGYKTKTEVKLQKESSATIVWNVLAEMQIIPFIWNAFPLHPHKEGNIYSNRKPNARELEYGLEILSDIISYFDIANVIAVGNTACETVSGSGIDCIKVRHPAKGGKAQFREEMLNYAADVLV